MRGVANLAVVVCGVVVLSALAVSCASWKWSECRKVGHSALYCVYDMGRD